MFLSSIILGTLAFYFWLRVRHCHKRSSVHDGNIEGIGLFAYYPLALLTTGLSIFFFILALFGN